MFQMAQGFELLPNGHDSVLGVRRLLQRGDCSHDEWTGAFGSQSEEGIANDDGIRRKIGRHCLISDKPTKAVGGLCCRRRSLCWLCGCSIYDLINWSIFLFPLRGIVRPYLVIR